MTGEPTNVECILIADDLTGACDAGVQFARRGLSCRVELNLPKHSVAAIADVLAFNTNSRNEDVAQSRRKIEELAMRCFELKAKIIFKKIDSRLHGNVKQETATALQAFGCTAAIIAPALPAMGRVVRDGILRWAGCSGEGQIDICHLLAQHGMSLEKMATIRIKTQDFQDFSSELDVQIDKGKQFFIVDSESQHDLQFTVASGIKLAPNILWVGSAGLGMALANHIGNPHTRRSNPATTDGPLMFVIGSTHLATLQQKKTLLTATSAVEVAPTPGTIDRARHALRGQRHLVVTIEFGNVSESCLRQFFSGLEGIRVSAMFLTGGDTGTLVCKAIGAHSIDLCDEIATGFPWGILCGGMFHGLPVASKSGSFGERDALLRCAEFFGRRESRNERQFV